MVAQACAGKCFGFLGAALDTADICAMRLQVSLKQRMYPRMILFIPDLYTPGLLGPSLT